MGDWNVDLLASVVVTVDDEEAVTRITGPGGDEWRSMFYDLRTEQDVLEHWAYNAVANGVESASRLDGWADLSRDAVTMRIDRVDLEAVDPL